MKIKKNMQFLLYIMAKILRVIYMMKQIYTINMKIGVKYYRVIIKEL